MYGSSFRMETRRPRALRMRPTLAAVMPLPREEVTPPVTKTYFAMDQVLRGFFECYRKTLDPSNRKVPTGGCEAHSRDRRASRPGRAAPTTGPRHPGRVGRRSCRR